MFRPAPAHRAAHTLLMTSTADVAEVRDTEDIPRSISESVNRGIITYGVCELLGPGRVLLVHLLSTYCVLDTLATVLH